MNEQPDFLDSHVPFDEEICTHEAWPLPEPRKFAPVAEAEPKSWRENLRALVERVKLWQA